MCILRKDTEGLRSGGEEGICQVPRATREQGHLRRSLWSNYTANNHVTRIPDTLVSKMVPRESHLLEFITPAASSFIQSGLSV